MGTVENKKEVWQYFFEKPKRNYNKYMFEMVEYPDYLMYDNEKVDSRRQPFLWRPHRRLVQAVSKLQIYFHIPVMTPCQK